MKNNRTEIQSYLERLRKLSKTVTKLAKEKAEAEEDSTRFAAEIEELGEPHYKDQAKITRIATLTRQLELCNREMEVIEEKYAAAVQTETLQELIYKGGQLVIGELRVIQQRRLETVAATLAPFSSSKRSALAAAEATDACRSAASAIANYGQLGSSLIYAAGRTPSQVLAALGKIEAVLTEALKDAPDYMKFLVFTPSEGTENATPNEE